MSNVTQAGVWNHDLPYRPASDWGGGSLRLLTDIHGTSLTSDLAGVLAGSKLAHADKGMGTIVVIEVVMIIDGAGAIVATTPLDAGDTIKEPGGCPLEDKTSRILPVESKQDPVDSGI